MPSLKDLTERQQRRRQGVYLHGLWINDTARGETQVHRLAVGTTVHVTSHNTELETQSVACRHVPYFHARIFSSSQCSHLMSQKCYLNAAVIVFILTIMIIIIIVLGAIQMSLFGWIPSRIIINDLIKYPKALTYKYSHATHAPVSSLA